MKMPKVGGAGKFKAPKISGGGKPMKIHPAAQARIRLPQGMDNTGDAAPAPWLPGVGKI
jgi:hypothetical protein